MDEQSISHAFDHLSQARQKLAEATEYTILARQALEHERGARLMTGEIVGKNEAEREARARELLMELYLAVEGAERDERKARLDMDLARFQVERLDYLLRWMTVSRREG